MPSPGLTQVIRRSSTDHPLTADWVRRVQAAGGSVSTQSRQAHNYLAGALVGTMGLDPANLYGHTFDGGIYGVTVPFFNRAGAVAAATNSGFVAGDYSAESGLAQSGTKRLESLLTPSAVGLVAWGFAAYHSGQTSASSFDLFGGATSANNRINFGYRNSFLGGVQTAGVDSGGGFVSGVAAGTAAGRLGFSSLSSTEFNLYRNGTADGTSATARNAPTSTTPIWFGGRNVGGTLNNPATCTMAVSLIGTGTLTAAQHDQLQVIVREYLIRRGRPPCD
jgi:hypothetical protein